MTAAANVLKNIYLMELITQFQDGLPIDLMEITCLTNSIVISPSFNMNLKNLPPDFKQTSYLQLFHHDNQIPNVTRFLSDYCKEPSLPLYISIMNSDLNHVEMWIKHKPEWLTPTALKFAVICGGLEIVKSLVNASKNIWTPNAMDIAAVNGYLDIVKFLHNVDCGLGCTVKAMDGAATYGHLHVVKFLHENRSEGCTAKAFEGAVHKGYADVVEYLLNHCRNQCTSISNDSSEDYQNYKERDAGEKDYIGVLRCLVTRTTFAIDENLILTAITQAPLPTLEFVYQNNIYGITKRVLETLIEIGNKNAIRYALEIILTENNKPLSLLDFDLHVEPWTPVDNLELLSRSHAFFKQWKKSIAMDIAASKGDLDTIQLLHRTGIKCCSVNAMNKAAGIGRLDIVEWLHLHRTEGCNDRGMNFAIAAGHLEVVKWLHEVLGLKCTKHGLSTAAYNGDADMVEYLLSIPFTAKDNFHLTEEDDYIFFSTGDELYHVYHGNAVDLAASNGYLNIVKLLHAHRATTDAMDGAVRNGHFEVVKYLHTHRKEGCTKRAYENAVGKNRLDILKYLWKAKCCCDCVNFEDLCIAAVGCNNVEMLAYCMSHLNGEITPNLKQKLMYKAAMYGLLDTVKWLHEVKGFGCTSTIHEVAETRGHKRVVQYLETIRKYEEDALHSLWLLLQRTS